MLSPGTYHTEVPTGLYENLALRQTLYAHCRDHPEARDLVREMCRQDFLYFARLFAWENNPRETDPAHFVGPFIPYPCQEEAVREILACIDAQEDAVIEKSREMGATWLCLIVAVWLFLFHEWRDSFLISKNEESVSDRKSKKSLFWKIDFMLKHLPGWLLPPGWDWRQHATGKTYNNPATGSSIMSEATTESAGRAGRTGLAFIDEFSVIKQDVQIFQSTAATAACRIFNGTHDGMETMFYQLIYGQQTHLKVIRLHWSDHPEKKKGAYTWDQLARRVQHLDPDYEYPPDYPYVREFLPAGGYAPGLRSPWYDKECRRLNNDSRKIAEEQDIDPKGSTNLVFNPLVINDLKIATKDTAAPWVGEVLADEKTGAFRGFRADPKGPLKLWFDPEAFPAAAPARQAGTKLSYAAGCDIARGRGQTPTCLAVANNLGDKLAEFSSRWVNPFAFAPLAVALCHYFQDAFLTWEIPGAGSDFGDEVLKLGYQNVYFQAVNQGDIWKERQSGRPGWPNSPRSVTRLIEAYKHALEVTRAYRNPSIDALDECLRFVHTRLGIEYGSASRKGDRNPGGEGLNHGDLVIADALCWFGIEDKYVRIIEGKPEDDPAPFGSIAHRRLISAQREREEAWT